MDAKNGLMEALSTPRVGRRRFLGGVGASGLAAAGVVFGFAGPAQALVPVGCCTLCCKSTGSLGSCESGSHYVWSCTIENDLICDCCEHGNPCSTGCNSSNYSTAYCSY